MRLRLRVVAVWLVALSLQACDRSPAEADIQAALQQQVDQSLSAFGALGAMMGKQDFKGPQATVGEVQKLACVRAEGLAGYQCDFIAKISAGDNAISFSHQSNERFIKVDGVWVIAASAAAAE